MRQKGPLASKELQCVGYPALHLFLETSSMALSLLLTSWMTRRKGSGNPWTGFLRSLPCCLSDKAGFIKTDYPSHSKQFLPFQSFYTHAFSKESNLLANNHDFQLSCSGENPVIPAGERVLANNNVLNILEFALCVQGVRTDLTHTHTYTHPREALKKKGENVDCYFQQ